MRRTFFVLVLTVALALTAFVPAVLAADAVVLSLWTHQRHMMDLVQELLDEFNTTLGAEKGIHVNLTVVGDDGPNFNVVGIGWLD